MERNVVQKNIQEVMLDCGMPQFGICAMDTFQGKLISVHRRHPLPLSISSLIVTIFPYFLGELEYINCNISRYAVVSDYHQVAGAMLQRAAGQLRKRFPGEEFVTMVDTSPIPEVWAAASAGLGKIGKHNLLITPQYGSWVFIGEIATSLFLQPHQASIEPCERCFRCVDACPTGALGEGAFRPEKCLSRITQKKGKLTPQEEAHIKGSGYVWGCDICQKACPHNEQVLTTPIDAFIRGKKTFIKDANHMEDRAYNWRGKDVILRNLCIVAPFDENNNEEVKTGESDEYAS